MKRLLMPIFLLLLMAPLWGSEEPFLVGAFDPPVWHGVVMVKGDGAFAFRFMIH